MLLVFVEADSDSLGLVWTGYVEAGSGDDSVYFSGSDAAGSVSAGVGSEVGC